MFAEDARLHLDWIANHHCALLSHNIPPPSQRTERKAEDGRSNHEESTHFRSVKARYQHYRFQYLVSSAFLAIFGIAVCADPGAAGAWKPGACWIAPAGWTWWINGRPRPKWRRRYMRTFPTTTSFWRDQPTQSSILVRVDNWRMFNRGRRCA